ncbi:acyl-CoA dehydrogenase family protein [Nocardia jinanensis]|uniref:Acyl-CoA dehydrogenase n=1 Tax=Nocardia jinanensis TaxID=382504 RepID=A0A917RQZ1_9NOCA|nr:acyl-CoA dehydrogenase family protein [Nocardia jinanensis]GGL18975.1 acyl-CoA dehydrogenase [Nocardia jinanensis]
MMSGEFTEFHDELRTVARELLGKCGAADGIDWPALVRAGWTGLEVADGYGGAAAGYSEVGILLEEVGRAAARTAYPSVASVGIGALSLLEPNAHRDAVLRETVTGTAIPIAVLGGNMVPAAGGETACAGTGGIVPTFRLTQTTEGFELSGTADFVLDSPAATTLLIPAHAVDGTVRIALVASGASGLRIDDRPVVDETRSVGQVSARGVVLAAEAVRPLPADGGRGLRALYDRAALAVACDSAGICAAMLDVTVEYVRLREQFGRPVGSFQAVKHACADMLVDLTIARRLVSDALSVPVDGSPDSVRAVSAAKAYTGEAGVRIAGKAVQLHGGIGYTWESGIHRYLKRATLNRALFGSPADHRREFARRYRED